MSFTQTAAGGIRKTTAGVSTLNIAAAPGQLIAIAAINVGSTGAAAGSILDSGANSYLTGAAVTALSSYAIDTFYCLAAANPITSITYTPGYANGSGSTLVAWVQTPTGVVSYVPGSAAYTVVNNTPDNVTTGVLNVTADGIVMGMVFDPGSGRTPSAGTGMISDGFAVGSAALFNNYEHVTASVPTAATWTVTAAAGLLIAGLGFQILAPPLTLMGQIWL